MGSREAWGGEDPGKPYAVRQASRRAGGASPHGPANSCQLLSGLFPGGGRGVWGRDGLPGASGRTQAEEIGQREGPQAKGPSCWQLAARAPRQLQQWELRVCWGGHTDSAHPLVKRWQKGVCHRRLGGLRQIAVPLWGLVSSPVQWEERQPLLDLSVGLSPAPVDKAPAPGRGVPESACSVHGL